jgi:hypothetical protein
VLLSLSGLGTESLLGGGGGAAGSLAKILQDFPKLNPPFEAIRLATC